MGERTHRIRRQVVEVEIADEGDARPLQERLSRLHRQRIAAAIERACDAIAGGGAIVRLERVTVDLGEIAADELEEVLVERLCGRLEGTLRRVVQGETRGPGARAPGEEQGEARRVDDAQAALEELTIFARTGALPWWAGDRGGDHLQRRAEALLAASPGALVRLLRGLVAAGERRSVARLVELLDDRLLGELAARSLAPASLRTLARAGGPAEAAAEIVALLDAPEAVAERTPRARRNLAWRGLLEVVGRSGAGAMGLPTAELYGVVIEVVAAIVGRSLPGAARRLRLRVQGEARGAADGGEGRGAAPSRPSAAERPKGESSPVGGDISAGAGASARLSKEPGAASRGDERVATRDVAGEQSARSVEAAREVLRGAAQRASPSGTSVTAGAQRPGAERVEAARAADTGRRGEVPSSKVSSDRSSAAPQAPTRGAAEAVEAWMSAAEDAVAVVGAGPPGIEGRRRLDRLIAALVALAPRVAEWPEAERAARLLAAVDPATSSRRGVEFSLMALVGGAASRLATAEVKALRGGLEALLERARSRERGTVEDPSRGASAASEAAADDTSHSAVADDTTTPGAGATRDGRGPRGRGAAATGARSAVRSDMSLRDGGLDSRSAERTSGPTARRAETRAPRAAAAPSARARDANASAGDGSGARALDDAAQAENVHAPARRVVASSRGPEDPATGREPSLAPQRSSIPARGEPLAERRPVDVAARARSVARPPDTSPRRRSPPSLPSVAALRDDALYIDDAGMVLLWPFIPFFLRHLGLVEERRFVDAEARLRAAALLRVAVSGEREIAEYQLPLAKVLCGLELDALFELDTPVSDEEEAEATAMIEAVIARAPILGRMSVAGLRGSFLLRPGALRLRDGAWLLQVERQSFDVVLDRFPWSSAWVKLPWMDEPVQVEW